MGDEGHNRNKAGSILFLKALAERKWDIGICPLAHTSFNAVKANTKWVEYTACGMATIATRGLVYESCAGDGRGLLVSGSEWGDALQVLTDDPTLRYHMALQAQTHLLLNYSETSLRGQVLDAFANARSYHAAGLGAQTGGRRPDPRPRRSGPRD